jgi:pSer/pThr/pTyr-binding forkhead associated (FHA) protein
MSARINVIEPNGVRRSLPVGSKPLFIGRDPDCDIVIGYERASRHHAQIAFDGQSYYVIDLNSTNGTFLGRTRLAPNTPTEWSVDVPVRIGDIYFRLELPKSYEQQQEEMAAMETVAGYLPGQNEANGGSKVLLWVAVGLIALCICSALLSVVGYVMYTSL